MALRIQATTNRKVSGNIAFRAYKVDDGAVGGNPLPVYKVLDADLIENGGNFKVSGNNPNQFLVYEVENETPLGGSAIPMYIVNDTPPVPPALDPEYLAVEAFYSQIPSTTWRNAASQFFIDVRDALGIATLADGFDFMYLLAHEDDNDALINIVSPGTHDATNVNAMAFESQRGFTGNGSNSYLNSNYNPATQGINLTLNNACIGFYSRTNNNPALGPFDIGCNTTHYLYIGSRGSDFFVGSANAGSASLFFANSDSSSLITFNRGASNSQIAYRAGTAIGSNATPSTAVPNANIYIACNNSGGVATGFTTRQYTFAFAGGSMNASQQANFLIAVETFMDAIGAGVIVAPIEAPSVVFTPLTEVNELGNVLIAQQAINPTSSFGAYAGL